MIQKFQNDEFPKGLLVLAPFFLSVTSLYIGFSLGLISAVLVLFFIPCLYILRKFIPAQQKPAFILVPGISWLLIVRMFLDVEAYSIMGKVGLFLPLLLMNSWVLTVSESVFSTSGFKSAVFSACSIGVAILLFFVIFGFTRGLLSGFSILSSPAGCFFLSGFLFAAINLFNQKKSL